MMGWLVEQKKIEPHIPLWDRSERTDGTFGRCDFRFDAANNHYICPTGKYLKPSGRMKKKDPQAMHEPLPRANGRS
jgi:hypothetical protein